MKPFLPRTGAIAISLLAFSFLTFGQQKPKSEAPDSERTIVESGKALFQQDCAFCHGRDAGGGETGPDLTASKLVSEDKDGDKIGVVVRNGRLDKGMPRFDLPDQQIASLVAFIHDQKKQADSLQGGRRGVDASDLQTGNVDEGKRYFSGAGGCSGCHSPSGDLAHVAARYEGLKLEERMLYPEGAAAKLTVTLPSGETVEGELAYQDEFTVALRDQSGNYHSWRARNVKFKIDAPTEAHHELLSKYTDADIHNLMAYLQTLK